jgi:hypothetical protein
LGLKDFNADQHRKYKLLMGKYRIVYLIGYDAVVLIEKGKIYTTDPDKYKLYQLQIKDPSAFDEIIKEFNVEQVTELKTLFETQ